MDLLAPLVVLVVIVGIFAIMLGGMGRLRGRKAFSFEPGDGSALAGGLLIALSASGLLAPLGIGGGVVTGASLGILFAVLRLLGKRVYEFAAAVLAVVGSLALLQRFFTGVGECTSAADGTRGVPFIVLLLLALGGALAGTFLGGFKPTAILAAFGAAEVLVFLASPLGVDLSDIGPIGWIVAGASAALLGFGGALKPDWVIGFAALGVGAATLAVSIGFGTPCEAHSFDGLTAGIGYLVTYLLVSGGARGLGLGR